MGVLWEKEDKKSLRSIKRSQAEIKKLQRQVAQTKVKIASLRRSGNRAELRNAQDKLLLLGDYIANQKVFIRNEERAMARLEAMRRRRYAKWKAQGGTDPYERWRNNWLY